MTSRHFSSIDNALINLDQAVRTVFGRPKVTERANPAEAFPDVDLATTSVGTSAADAGEPYRRGLRPGALSGAGADRSAGTVRENMERSAQEENDHLAWCEQRLDELGARKSLLNPLWYAGSFAMGAAAGLAGDKWSLGFVVETERQVEDHLDDHLAQVPGDDQRTRAILEQMKADEIHHADVAYRPPAEPSCRRRSGSR
jgi:ubiquinone biosynthesis monooxygenase Coq7